MWSLLSLFALADEVPAEAAPDAPAEEEIGDEHGDLSPEANAEYVDGEPIVGEGPPTIAEPVMYAVSDGSSHLVVVLIAPDGSKAHDHAVAATFVTGEVTWSPDPALSSIQVAFPANGLVADTDELRTEAGFEDLLKEKHQAKVREHLLAPDQLNEAEHGDISFTSTSIVETDGGFQVTGDMTLRGVTTEVNCLLAVVADASTWRATGSFGITASQFGFEPYAFGKYFNDDAMTVNVQLAAGN